MEIQGHHRSRFQKTFGNEDKNLSSRGRQNGHSASLLQYKSPSQLKFILWKDLFSGNDIARLPEIWSHGATICFLCELCSSFSSRVMASNSFRCRKDQKAPKSPNISSTRTQIRTKLKVLMSPFRMIDCTLCLLLIF